jgi:CRP-like cAMP-binding protein/tetratricopeptide (TPR) repeat protein
VPVEAEEKSVNRDEVIFREGEPSSAAYMVVSGHVELTKQGSHGPVLVGFAGPMDFFGETTLFDDTPYDVTARATDKARIRVVSRAGLVEWLNTHPGAASRIGAMLAERLRSTHLLILDQHERQLAKGGGGKGVIGLIGDWLKKLAKPKPGEGGRPQFSIAIATMNNDIDGAWTRALAALLEGRNGVGVTILPTGLQIEPGADQAQAMAAASRARAQLAKDESVDLLIWGDVHADGYSLWFSPQGKGDEERPGCFNLFTSLELPGDQEPPAGDLLFLAALAAMEVPEERRSAHAMALRGAEVPLQDLLANLPVAWNLEQQRTALTVYGHALATLTVLDPGGPWSQQAIECYRAALLRLPPGELGIDSGELHKHLGMLLMAQGERSPDPAWLEQAVAAFKAAAESLAKARYPLEWGGVQNRLGLALYRLDLATGHPELLKEAMVAFQSALQAFPRHDSPQRWAEVMHNLAQVLQVYGDQMKSADVLERAVETARAAIELRPRLKVPFEWAASQNTLGTALFMLAKHSSRGIVKLDEATAAINGALEVYRQFGATRLAEVTEKNLVHLQKLAKQKKPGPVQPVHWFEQEDEQPANKKG